MAVVTSSGTMDKKDSSVREYLANRADLVGAIRLPNNMLKITNDGRKLALDQRLINDLLPDEPESKVNLCVENAYQVWEESTPDKYCWR